MNRFEEAYQSKLRTPEELAAAIQPGWLCATGAALSEPQALTRALGERARRENLRGITHSQLLSCYPSPFFQEDLRGKYSAVSWYTAGAGRMSAQQGRTEIMPAYYRDVPSLWRQYLEPDVFYCTVSPMDRHGWFSFGCTGSEVEALLEKARLVYLEVNPNMPRTFGSQHIHISRVDGLCECGLPLAEAPPAPIDDASRVIGGYIADCVRDGSTIQLGIGAIPDAVGQALCAKRNLGIHTELFTESMVDLIECGAVTNWNKPIHKGKSVTTFAQGTRRMYDFLDDNPGVEFHSVDHTNDPAVIASHPDFVSVNACVEVDFYGQVCAESIGPRHYSGTGGQVDFVRGAVQSRGGQSFIACTSTGKNGTISKIKPTLKEGAIVTTSKNDVDCIVTEYGIAKLRGRTVSQRAKALILIAHPKFRDELRFEAKKRNIIL